MHTVNAQTIISYSPFLFHLSLSLSVLLFQHLHLSVPLPFLFIHSPCHSSVHSDRDRLGEDWPIARLSLRNDFWPQTGSRVGVWGWDKVSGAVSHALRPEGQHFKQDDPQTSLQMKPNFHWPNCCGLQDPPPPPKPRASGSPLTAVYPKLAWGELRLSNSCAMSQLFFPLSSSGKLDPSVTQSSISTLKCVLVKLWYPPLYHAFMQAGQGNLGPLLGKQCSRIQFQEYWSCENHASPKCQLFMRRNTLFLRVVTMHFLC